ncbi:glycosyltransferase family 1 protein [Piloderma croceum F 1598]|uniref:UDP-N-acetylglucosamine transferase subunit ALG13 n=1 Tax=Piloderma croceum (strain F 1598) TaxID=765440 RepID=A0A0C3CBE8_PILCF|nr:glycosyltransferase family 1 protein [Piloderma croceum F 1598]
MHILTGQHLGTRPPKVAGITALGKADHSLCMLAFTTVGSTKFDALVQAVLSKPVLTALRLQGYTTLVVQSGNSVVDAGASTTTNAEDMTKVQKDGVEIEIWKFKPSLETEYDRADLVISHAGSGTILEVLRLGKWLIVVPNPTLLDNHQEDLASSLNTLGHLKACTVDDLPQTIEDFDPSAIEPFPPFDGGKFSRLLEEEMGFL